ncbi:MAG: FecR domain-containing protein [Nitrospirota bacterium]
MSAISATPTLSIALGPNNIGQFSLGYNKKDFLLPPTDVAEDRDANVFSASVAYIYLFLEGKGFLNLKYEMSKEDTNGENWDYSSNKGSINILIPLKLGDPVFVSDIIRAKSKSKAEITFINDNILRVAENTRVEIAEYIFEEAKSSGVLKLSRGKVQAIVPKKIAKRIATFGEANRLEVHTPMAIAVVRGTDFFTFHQRDVTGVLVKDGKVEVYNPKFPEVVVTVTAGNITIVPENKPAQPPRPATDAEIKGHEGDVALGEKPVERTEAEEIGGIPAPPAPEEVPAPAPLAPIIAPAVVTEIPITEGVIRDTTPPVVTIVSQPASLTNLTTASFSFSSTEPSTYSYRLDEGSWTTTTETLNLSNLTEGSHTLEVKATDAAGNTSTASYTWTTDYTAPVITLAAYPESGTGLTSIDLSIQEINQSVPPYSYRLDGEAWIDATEPVSSLSGLEEGSHTLEYSSTDLVGNTTSDTLSFDLSRYSIGGEFYGCISEVTGKVEGEIAGVSNQNWGWMDYGYGWLWRLPEFHMDIIRRWHKF